ncbi:MAG: hypothetical protein ACXVRK_01945 [Gaiellaceae bacterium]
MHAAHHSLFGFGSSFFSALGLTSSAASPLAPTGCGAGGAIANTTGFEDDDGNLKVDGGTACTDWNGFAPATWLPANGAPYQSFSKTVAPFTIAGSSDAVNSGTDTTYVSGTAGKQDQNCPGLTTGPVPNKDDLARIYVAGAQNLNGGDTYLYLAWVRATQQTPNSDLHVAFEFNQGSTPCANSAGLVNRTDGDMLISYNFQSSTPTLTLSTWDSTLNSGKGAWGPATTLVSPVAEGAVWTSAGNPPGGDALAPTGAALIGQDEFGEAGIDLTLALQNQTHTGKPCETFGSALGASRSSGESTTANMEDLVAPVPIHLSNCVSPTVTTALKNAADNSAIANGSSVPLGSSVYDTASFDSSTLISGKNPTGTVKYTFYTGGDCSTGTIAGTQTVTVSGGSIPNFDPPTAALGAGSYAFRAQYFADSSDANYSDSVPSVCEPFTVDKGTLTLATTIHDASHNVVGGATHVPLGSVVHDNAKISGAVSGFAPTGAISFTLNGNSVANKASAEAGFDATSVDSASLAAGSYTYQASIAADSNYNTATSPTEPLTVDKAPTDLTTTVFDAATDAPWAGSELPGAKAYDTSTLTGKQGSFDPTGTVTYTFFSGDCATGTQVFTDQQTVGANEVVPNSKKTDALPAGSYAFQAVYSGDDNYSGKTGECEPFFVGKTTPKVSTQLSETTGSVGDTVHDSATISGATADAGGTINYAVYSDNTCKTLVADLTPDNNKVVNGVAPDSKDHTFNSAGTFYFQATYSGDDNNGGPVSSPCESEQLVINAADIKIVKTPDATQVNAGEQIGFTLTVYNDGLGDARGVKLTDTLPVKAGLNWSIAGQGSDWGGSCSIDAGVLTCGGANGATVPAGTTQAASKFTVHITSPTTAATGGACPDGSGVINNTGDVSTTNDGSDESKASTCVAAPAIHIVKTPDAALVNAGEQIGFTLTVYNDGSGDAHGVTLTDTLPVKAGLDWSIAGTGAGWGDPTSCAINSGVLTCGPATVPAGTTQAASTFTVHITSPTTAETGGTCPEGSGVIDNTGHVATTNDGSGDSTASTCVAAPAIHIVKTADAAQVNVGSPIGFTLTVSNDGSGDAHGVTLSDTLPTNAGLSWSIASQGAGWNGSCAIAAGKLTCGPVTVPAGTTQAASTFTVHITSPTTGATGGDCPETGVVDNTGSVTTSNDGSDQSSASVCVQAVVDLAITKTGSPATQDLGQGNITWTMVVTNNGPSTATGVKVSDPMPAGNTYVSSTSTQGTCTGGAILNCDIGTMAAGATVTITLITTPSQPGTQTNTAVVSSSRPESNLANNTATASVEVTAPLQLACVRITKITPGQLVAGRKTQVTIHLAQKNGSVKGIRARIKGAGINVKTAGANSKGIIRHTLKVKKQGILVFTPLASPSCVSRIGVRGVFTPPVTG